MSLAEPTTYQRIPAAQALALIAVEADAAVFDVRDAASYQRGLEVGAELKVKIAKLVKA
jgi:rhodanese-related sulfurtransferase